MSAKTLVMLGMTIGSSIGGYLPALFGVSLFSTWSLVGTLVGGLLGIWIGWKLANW